MARSELYQFKHGDKQWFFTSARKAITHNAITYFPVRGLSRGNIEDADIDKCEVELIFPHPYPLFNDADDSFTQVFLNKIYLESVYFTLIELDGSESLVLFKGRVTQPKFDDRDNTMTLVCSTAESFMRRKILTRKYQRTCPNMIYDRWCGLDIGMWAFDVEITQINGKLIQYTPIETQQSKGVQLLFEQKVLLDDNGNIVYGIKGPIMVDDHERPIMVYLGYQRGYLDRGFLLKDGVYTMIISGYNGSLSLYRSHVGLEVGDIVKIAPGCNQSHSMCRDKFQNHRRFGGHNYMLVDNPLETQLIK